MIQEISLYLNRAHEIRVIPNFFMSVPYLLLTGGTVVEKDGWIWVEDGGQFICPPLPLKIPLYPLPKYPIWSSFPSNSPELEYLKFYNKELLDEQYIYDPSDFLAMEGGIWETFRKNARKIPKRYSGKFQYCNLGMETYEEFGVNQLILDWLMDRSENVEDAEFLANFALLSDMPEIHREFLLLDGELVGMNAWDENYHYINYRICIVKKGIQFLSEFLRWLFYSKLATNGCTKLVNDGGNLGNPELAKFKLKLNPIQINKVYTLTPR